VIKRQLLITSRLKVSEIINLTSEGHDKSRPAKSSIAIKEVLDIKHANMNLFGYLLIIVLITSPLSHELDKYGVFTHNTLQYTQSIH